MTLRLDIIAIYDKLGAATKPLMVYYDGAILKCTKSSGITAARILTKKPECIVGVYTYDVLMPQLAGDIEYTERWL